MNWDRIEGNWKQAKGKIKEQWGKLTDDHLDTIGGKRDQLVGIIVGAGVEIESAGPAIGDIGESGTVGRLLAQPGAAEQRRQRGVALQSHEQGLQQIAGRRHPRLRPPVTF